MCVGSPAVAAVGVVSVAGRGVRVGSIGSGLRRAVRAGVGGLAVGVVAGLKFGRIYKSG